MRARGFTLIEIVIALGLMSALILLCARLATANIQLANGIQRQQSENTLREGFFEMLKLQLGALPGNVRLELQQTEGAPPYESSLLLQNVPMAFTWGGAERIAKAVEIAGVKRRDGFMNVVMKYYENPILADEEQIVDDRREEPFAEVTLMEGLRFFEWRALDGRSMEWQLNWELQGRLPLQLELVTAMGATGEEMKQIIWIVPKVSPAVIIRQNAQNPLQGSSNPGVPVPDAGAGGGSSGQISIDPGAQPPVRPGGGRPSFPNGQ